MAEWLLRLKPQSFNLPVESLTRPFVQHLLGIHDPSLTGFHIRPLLEHERALASELW